MEQTEETITTEEVLATMQQTWTRMERVLERFAPVLDAGPDAGGWTPRQLLSHLTGAWQRVPIHSAFFLADRAEVPIVFGESYRIPEWENAPLEGFTLAMRAAYEGNQQFRAGSGAARSLPHGWNTVWGHDPGPISPDQLRLTPGQLPRSPTGSVPDPPGLVKGKM